LAGSGQALRFSGEAIGKQEAVCPPLSYILAAVFLNTSGVEAEDRQLAASETKPKTLVEGAASRPRLRTGRAGHGWAGAGKSGLLPMPMSASVLAVAVANIWCLFNYLCQQLGGIRTGATSVFPQLSRRRRASAQVAGTNKDSPLSERRHALPATAMRQMTHFSAARIAAGARVCASWEREPAHALRVFPSL